MNNPKPGSRAHEAYGLRISAQEAYREQPPAYEKAFRKIARATEIEQEMRAEGEQQIRIEIPEYEERWRNPFPIISVEEAEQLRNKPGTPPQKTVKRKTSEGGDVELKRMPSQMTLF